MARDKRDFKRIDVGVYRYRGYELTRFNRFTSRSRPQERWRCRPQRGENVPYITDDFHSRAYLAAHIDKVLDA